MPTLTREAALEHMGFQAIDTPNDDEIKQRYRKLALQHHPDKGGDRDKFQAISNAYELLKQLSINKPIASSTKMPAEETPVWPSMNEDFFQEMAFERELLRKKILASLNVGELDTKELSIEQIINRFSESFILLISAFKNLKFEDPELKLPVTRKILTSIVNESVSWQPSYVANGSNELPCFAYAVRDLCQAISTLNLISTPIKNPDWFAKFVEDHFTHTREKNFSHMLTLIDFYSMHTARIANAKLQSPVGNRAQEQQKLDIYLAQLDEQRKLIVELIHIVIDNYEEFSKLFDKSVTAEPDRLLSDLSLEVAQSMVPQGSLQLEILRQTLVEHLKSWSVSSLFNRSVPPKYSHPNLAKKLQENNHLSLAEIRCALKEGLSENGNFGFAMNRYLKSISANSRSNDLTTIISGIAIAHLPRAIVEGQLALFPFNSRS